MDAGFTVKIVRCQNLPAKDEDGFSDPYVKLYLGTQPKQKTKILKKTLNPVFNQDFKFKHWGSSEKLIASVWDWNRVQKKVFIGQVEFKHPEKGIVNGVFPLTNQRGEPVGGTMEVTITSEYLVGVERRASISRRRKSSGTEALSTSGRGLTLDPPGSNQSDRKELSPSTDDEGHSPISPPVFIHGMDDSRQQLQFTPEDGGAAARQRERERDAEKEKKREEERAEREKEKKERAEQKVRFEEFMKRFAHLEAENKKQSATIETLEREVAELRQTVAGLEQWSNEGKAHALEKQNKGFSAWFSRTFSCCYGLTKRSKNKQQATKLEDETEMSQQQDIRTNGSI